MPQNPTFVRPAAAGRIHATDPQDLKPCLKVRWLIPQGGRGRAGAPSPNGSEPRRFVHPLATTPRRDMSPIKISISNAVEVSHDPFQGITDLEGCSLAGVGSALPRQRLTVTPLNKELALWRQVRGGRTMDSVRADIAEKFYSGDQAAAPFLDPERALVSLLRAT